jgi:hypothetical protein
MYGKVRRTPIAAMTFTKGEFPGMDKLTEVEKIQDEFQKELEQRDAMFGKKVEIVEVKDEQPEPTESLPTIQLEEEVPTLLDELDDKIKEANEKLQANNDGLLKDESNEEFDLKNVPF